MDFDRDEISRKLDLCLFNYGEDCLVRMMYHYFSGIAGHNDRSRAIICELVCAESFAGFDEDTCRSFKDWFTMFAFGGDSYEDFKALMSSPDVMLLCYSLYSDYFRLKREEIFLRSSDGEIFKMDKSVATAESWFLNDVVDRTGGQCEIPVPWVSSHVLPEIIHFCQKKRDLGKVLKNLVGHYKGWVTGFLKSNRAILSELHEAANYLNIRSLLFFTTPRDSQVGHDFMQLTYSLHHENFLKKFDSERISLKCSDGEVLMMDRSVATALSVVLNDLVDCTGGQGEIPVCISSLVLSEIIHFCEKKSYFREILEILVGHCKDWFTGFLKRNESILSDLYKIADSLNIPSLLVLTTQAVGDMVGRTLEETTEWCVELSISTMLSSLVAMVG